MIILERLQSLINLRRNEAIYIGGIPDLSKLGEIRNNNKGTPMKIIAYRNNNDIDIQFQDEFYYIKEHQTYSNFSTGSVKIRMTELYLVSDMLVLENIKPKKTIVLQYIINNGKICF